MNEEFDKFTNRINIFDERLDGLYAQTLPVLRDDKWREMRKCMNNFHSIDNIKEMYKLMMESVDITIGYLIDTITTNSSTTPIQSKHIFAHYTANVIASCCLGLEIDSNDHQRVYEIALKLTNCFGFYGKLKILLMTFLPRIYQALGFQLVNSSTRDFLHEIIIEKIKFRREQKVVRKDMLQFMLEANLNDEIKSCCWSEEAFIAQPLASLGAGFETITNFIQMTCYELAKNKEVQLELANEINKIPTPNRITFEALNNFKLLHCVMMESLRLWPPSFTIDRMCNSNCTLYTSEGDAYTFKNGDNIIIPVYEIHRNPEFFKCPEKFDPLRFYEKDMIIPGSYIPFGMGGRSCVGKHFSMLAVKLLLFHILKEFRIELCDDDNDKENVEYERQLRFIRVKQSKNKH